MKDQSDDPSPHEQTLLPLSYISLLKNAEVKWDETYLYDIVTARHGNYKPLQSWPPCDFKNKVKNNNNCTKKSSRRFKVVFVLQLSQSVNPLAGHAGF